MAHWAELNQDNVVLRVLATTNEGDEGLSWLESTLGGRWIKTSYNAKIRKNFAQIGFQYREDIDAFVPPKPSPSLVLNEQTAQWEPPSAPPQDGQEYYWDEASDAWAVFEENETPQA